MGLPITIRAIVIMLYHHLPRIQHLPLQALLMVSSSSLEGNLYTFSYQFIYCWYMIFADVIDTKPSHSLVIFAEPISPLTHSKLLENIHCLLSHVGMHPYNYGTHSLGIGAAIATAELPTWLMSIQYYNYIHEHLYNMLFLCVIYNYVSTP